MIIKNKKIVLIFILGIALGIIPKRFTLESSKSVYRGSDSGLADNSIADLKIGEEKIFVSTSGGLSYVRYNEVQNSDDSFVEFYHYSEDVNLPFGGNPALTSIVLPEGYDDYSGNTMVAVSGMESVDNQCGAQGTGISWSLDNGETWHYIEQPNDFEAVENQELYCTQLDEEYCEPAISGCSWSGEQCYYNESILHSIPFDWYGNQLLYKPINLNCNITYDITIDINRGYIYAASFTGVLRRFNFYDFDNDCIKNDDDCSQLEWEIVPLPTDSQSTVGCGGFSSTYEYNPWSEDNYNHRVFSVFVHEDNIWVGTGDGINKGDITLENCINWEHNSDDLNGHEWIIGIVPEYNDVLGLERIWLISWLLNEGLPPHSLTYTDDVGIANQYLSNTTWNQVSYFKDEAQALTENIFFDNDFMYVSTDKGLFYIAITEDIDFSNEDSWTLHEFPDSVVDIIQLENISSTVSYLDEYFFIGTPGGLIGYPCVNPENFNDPGCMAFQEFEYKSRSNLQIFPNPFRKGDPYSIQVAKFKYKTEKQKGKIDIFDFNMNKVTSFDCGTHPDIDGELYCHWDGLNDNNHIVANGVYFCRIHTGSEYAWEKLLVINYK